MTSSPARTAAAFAIFFGFLSPLVPTAAAVADGDAATSACLAEVRQQWARFREEIPDPKMQEAIGSFCERGDVEGALRFAVPEALPPRGEPAPPGPTEPAGPAGHAGPPAIFRFQATPSTVRAGEASHLSWDVYRSAEVTFDGRAVAPRGERVVRPDRTTPYTLEAASPVDRVAERVMVTVSPYPPATLGASFERIQVCRESRGDGEVARCIGSDGPFYAGDAVQVILRFDALPAGSHGLEYELFAGTSTRPTRPMRWTRIDHARGPFTVGAGPSPWKTFELTDPGRLREDPVR